MPNVSYPNLFVTISYPRLFASQAYRSLVFRTQALRTRNTCSHKQQTNDAAVCRPSHHRQGTKRLGYETPQLRNAWGTKSLGYETPCYEKVRVREVLKLIELRCCQYSLTSFVLLKCLLLKANPHGMSTC